VNVTTIKNLSKKIEVHEAELLDEVNHTKLAKEALEQEQEQVKRLVARHERKKEDFIHKIAELQSRVDEALQIKIELLE
jgi:hypothetical protein